MTPSVNLGQCSVVEDCQKAFIGLGSEENQEKWKSLQRIPPYTQYPGSHLGLTEFTESLWLKKLKTRMYSSKWCLNTTAAPMPSAEAK